jgi:hypothetical protein
MPEKCYFKSGYTTSDLCSPAPDTFLMLPVFVDISIQFTYSHSLKNLPVNKLDKLVKSQNSDGKVKSSSSRRREYSAMRRTYRTPQSQRDEAQRRNRTFYEAVKLGLRKDHTMSTRSMLFLMLLVLAGFLAVKFDVPTQVKMGVANFIYGDEMRGIKGFRVAVETLAPELEKEGLTREEVVKDISAMLEKGRVKVLSNPEWEKTSGKPVLNTSVYATKTGGNKYQYSVTIEVGKYEDPKPGTYSGKTKTLWLTSGVGEGGISDIRSRIKGETELFLKCYSGS